ncbi:hypothetical protein [Vagococcus fessus]|uniref:DUF4352 domain-containing protein n=1 Tax=Vagococcus fessus TaxID=120370 RepID=A0A430A543_9ENTE|nr:hypothetical protein [Vagococcus fessus]RSU01928.1 hypothetical protein CBF31_09165 [Vagococcus fessus]
MKKILPVVLLSAVLLVGCSSSNEEIESLKKENSELKEKLANSGSFSNERETSPTQNEPEQESSETKIIKNNEILKLGNQEKEMANFKITKVSTNPVDFPDFMQRSNDFNLNKMVSLHIEYSNTAIKEGFLPSTHDFQAYDTKGTVLNRLGLQDGQDKAAEGRTNKTKIFFELPTEGSEVNEIEVDYSNSGNKIATFNLKVSH